MGLEIMQINALRQIYVWHSHGCILVMYKIYSWVSSTVSNAYLCTWKKWIVVTATKADASHLEVAVSATLDNWGLEGNLLTESIVETLVAEPGVFERLRCAHPPALALHQQTGDEVFGLIRDVGELVHLKVPLAGQDVVERLVVVVAQERRQAAEPGAKESKHSEVGDSRSCASCTFILTLTACTWWRRGSTCPWGMKQTRSWWPRGLKIPAFQSWPSASPWVCTWSRHQRAVERFYCHAFVLKGQINEGNKKNVPPCQAKVDYFNLVCSSADT